MDIKTKETYSEVFSILNLMDDKYIKKIPVKLYNLIRDNRLATYNPNYKASESLINQKIKRETLAMLALFELNYWLETEEEKNEFKEKLKRNSEERSKEMREKYSSANIFKQINEAREAEKIKEEEVKEIEEKTREVIEDKKKGIFGKLFKK